MSFFRRYFLWFILFIALAVWSYQYYDIFFPCTSPVRYSLGTFDKRFNISEKEFVSIMEEATLIWEKALGKDLFSLDTKAKLKINLIYDERQAIAEKNRALSIDIDRGKEDAQEIKNQFMNLQERYEVARREYESLVSQYRKRKEIAFEIIENKRLEVNALADEVNALVKKYNFLVSSLNSTISTVNQHAGREFEEGEYIYDKQGERINIYEFANKAVLMRVLAHEFGHVLGLDHNDNPDSIMFYLNSSKNMKPTVEDIMDLKNVCRVK